eukprot:CAMPEP_0113565406 /NCGR_PEP_ID=MMETSP0015_2-20120614/22159_1 /TAXON_ID=2838 /ORGANISM="Odontella" /LENGTH=343 /DNA_ID=CAMNT_0000467599 /DNA_START=223 /DNA_END=1250 /DNA_ORIENTATION=+ /assembly_acc=CAM_ASM_000160
MKLRSALRSMGVRLFALDPGWDKDSNVSNDDANSEVREFCERRLDTLTKPAGLGEQEQKEAARAMKELEALRRVTVHGETVGAEISVSVARSTKKGPGPVDTGKPGVEKVFTPLCLQGDEDCMAFFELFLNSCGGTLIFPAGLGQADLPPISDVPLLLSRMPGSYQHMSLRTLSVTKRIDDYHLQLQRHKEHGADNGHGAGEYDASQSYVDLVGPILPSAAREMHLTAASLLVIDKIKEQRRMNSAASSNEENKDDINDGDSRESAATDVIVGSHFFVSVCDVLKGGQCRSAASKQKCVTGIPGSVFLNTGLDNCSARVSSDRDPTNPSSIFECSKGEVFTTS